MRRLVGPALLLSVLPALFFAGRYMWDRVGEAPGQVTLITSIPVAEREERTLAAWGSVPKLYETENLVRPVVLAEKPFATTFGFITPGYENQRPSSIRGATLLSHFLAPHAWVIGAPIELLEAELESEGPLGPLTSRFQECAFIVWAGVERARVEHIHRLAARRFGTSVLHFGRSNGRDHHVSLRFDVVNGLRSGDPAFRRFDLLAAP